MAGADRDGRVAEGDLQVGVADRAAATVALLLYALGLILSFFLPEPKQEELMD